MIATEVLTQLIASLALRGDWTANVNHFSKMLAKAPNGDKNCIVTAFQL